MNIIMLHTCTARPPADEHHALGAIWAADRDVIWGSGGGTSVFLTVCVVVEIHHRGEGVERQEGQGEEGETHCERRSGRGRGKVVEEAKSGLIWRS
jgi:hypothetical protein